MSGVARIGMAGHAPAATVSYPNPEKAKYEKMWELEQYRTVAPGEGLAMKFLNIVKPEVDSRVIDFGCGTGRGAVLIALLGRCDVTLVDFAPNCIDSEMGKAIEVQDRLHFLEHDLTDPLPITAPYGFCTDVMEHIPEEWVQVVLTNILKSAKKVFFNISTDKDSCGALIGETLHMTVKDAQWWSDQFNKLDCMMYAVEVGPNWVNFCVSGWLTMDDLHDHLSVNTSVEQVVSQVKRNINQDYKQVSPHEMSGKELMIALGGPSLNEFTDEIVEKRRSGMPLITVNGTYGWAIENGMKPSAQVMVDAREFNARFITEAVDTCRYLINSQCHEAVFEKLPEDQVELWHSRSHAEVKEVLDEHYALWYPIPGGCTVGLRAVVLMRFLGWKHMHIYGLDSCLQEDEHHAYPQPENDNEVLVNVNSNGKDFTCTQWMAMQADEFRHMVEFFGKELQLAVYGRGLIANLLEEANKAEKS